jgi:hypothetical protein
MGLPAIVLLVVQRVPREPVGVEIDRPDVGAAASASRARRPVPSDSRRATITFCSQRPGSATQSTTVKQRDHVCST